MTSGKSSVSLKPVRVWLWIITCLVFAMVVVGGATRITDSGLSITEWQPIMGAIPPLSDADWLAAFEKYKQIPEYSAINQGMQLAEFKRIFWWEWSHRFLGRFIGVFFLAGFLLFVAMRKISGPMVRRFAIIFLLGGAQGALGWYMVKSGLVGRTDVSQYRLAAHLVLASALFALIVWTALGLGVDRAWHPRNGSAGALLILALLGVQITAGGFVAGIDAGMGYNTWPKMDGFWIPPGLLSMEPAWRNFFENAMTVQFDHRVIAYMIAVVTVIHAWRTFSLSAMILAYAIFLQIGLGIFALVTHLPIALALVHQAFALITLATAVWHLHRKSLVKTASPRDTVPNH